MRRYIKLLSAVFPVVINQIVYAAALPGSGNAINFGSSAAANPSVVLTTFPNLTGNFTITAWVKVTNNTQIGQRIFTDDASKTDGYSFSLGDPGTGRLRFFSRGTSSGSNLLLLDGNAVLATNTWYHVAAAISNSTVAGNTTTIVSIYVNGILDVTSTTVRAGTFGTDAGNAGFGGEVPTSGEAGNHYYIHGLEDEVIVWNKTLTAAQIQTAMCVKQTTFTSMYGYWNCDNASTTAGVADLTTNAYNGTLSTGMANTDINTSGAAIGDASTETYTAVWTGVTLSLTATNGTVFTASAITGTPSGVQVYQVNSVPGSTTGITNIGDNNVYFGVYVVNGTSPTYSAKMDYTAYVKTNTAQAFTRQDNSVTTWTAGNTNTTVPPYAITQSGVAARSEFILGSTNTPLPIQLTSFDAVCNSGTALVQWSTATETNNDYFTIERTQNGENYETIGTVKGAGNSDQLLFYTFTDTKPLTGVSYYRLSQTDFDGTTVKFQNVAYQPCENETSINAYAYNGNNIKMEITSTAADNYTLNVMDDMGRTIVTKTYPIETGTNSFVLPTGLSTGIYMVHLQGTNSSYDRKIILSR